MYTHPCIKCASSYTSDDPDPYLCETCNAARLEIAKQVDAQMQNRPARSMSELQRYESLPKTRGLVNAKDLLGL